MAHLTAWNQPGGGHLRHIPRQPPCDSRLGPGPFRGHFRSSKREPERDRKWVSEWTSKETDNGLPKGAQRGLSKPDFKRLFSEKFFNIASLLIVSRCIASRRANVRSGPQSVQETEAGQTGVLVTTHSPPPEKLPLHSLRLL